MPDEQASRSSCKNSRAALGISWVSANGCRSIQRLLGELTPEEIWRAPAEELTVRGVRRRSAQAFVSLRARFDPDAMETCIGEADMRFVAHGSAEYPEELEQLADPPAGLYIRGSVAAWREMSSIPRVAVVGTRAATPVGLAAVETLCNALVEAGVAVVSGLALGIDGRAHEAALSRGGSTMAVLGSGADVVSPQAHADLYGRICSHGVISSELPPGHPAARWTFPLRNRLLAALGDAVLVVEAGGRSGALLTVAAALELGRSVFVAPGPITGGSFEGSLRLLYEGAVPAIEGERLVQDFLELTRNERGKRRPEPCARPTGEECTLDPAARLIEAALSRGPASIDELAAAVGVTVSEAAAATTLLELQGKIIKAGPGIYARAS